MGGNIYVVNKDNGQRLWQQRIGGATGGAVITYMADGAQRVAVAAGLTSLFWPTEPTATAKVVIFGL
jgi:alcohol dehydrogenase (cytochrome c)